MERKRNVPGNKHAIEAVRFSPDGKLYATAGWDGIVNVWDSATGAHLNALGGTSGWGILALAFTPDSKYLLAGTEIGALQLWDMTSANVLDTIQAHSGNIRAIAFSPDGKLVATASHDLTVKLWDWDALSVMPLPAVNGPR
jgi:WD40 repeat protein